MLSCLMFKSLSYFGFIFVYGERVRSSVIDLYVVVQLFQHHCWRVSFSIVYACPLCQELIDHRCVGLFLGPPFCSIDPYKTKMLKK